MKGKYVKIYYRRVINLPFKCKIEGAREYSSLQAVTMNRDPVGSVSGVSIHQVHL